MALVDDNMGEIIFGIVGGQKIRVAVFAFDTEGLVRGDMNAGVFCVVGTVRLAIYLGCIGAEDILKGLDGLGAEFVPVTDEEGAGEPPGIGYSLKQIDGDESLTGTRGKGQESAPGFPLAFALRDLFHDGADRCILIITPGAFAARISMQERSGGLGIKGVAHSLFITSAKFSRGGKLIYRFWGRGQAGKAVKLDELVAVGRKNEPDIVPSAFSVPFGLIETMTWGEGFSLCLYQRQSHGLRIDVDLDPQDVIDLAPRTAPGLAAYDLDGPRRFFAADKVLRPSEWNISVRPTQLTS